MVLDNNQCKERSEIGVSLIIIENPIVFALFFEKLIVHYKQNIDKYLSINITSM